MLEPSVEWLMMDASNMKAHCHAAGSVGGNQGIGLTKDAAIPRYIWPWLRMVCQCESFVTTCPVADCTQAAVIIEGIEAHSLIADKGYEPMPSCSML